MKIKNEFASKVYRKFKNGLTVTRFVIFVGFIDRVVGDGKALLADD